MKQINPERKATCSNCVFCDCEPPICVAFKRNTPISQREFYTRPDWCPFRPYPELF